MNPFRYKHIFLIIILSPAFLLAIYAISDGGPIKKAGLSQGKQKIEPIYVSFFSHNEEDDPYWLDLVGDRQRYEEYRSDLVAKIKLLRDYGAVLNWETDHVVLMAMKKYENGKLLKATNGKNILRWMVEDMGMAVDPHGHQSQYNNADLAYLIESMGVKPSSVVGGFELYRCGQVPGRLEQSNWKREMLNIDAEGTIRGRKFPHYSWRPKILGMPGMMGHIFDEFSSGVWRPQEEGDFLKHQANGRFIYIGQGYPHYPDIHASPNSISAWYNHVEYIRDLAGKIKSGQAPGGKIYTASVHLRDAKPNTSIASVKQTLEALKDLVQSGQIIYKDYEGVARIWREKYKEQPNRFGIENFSIYDRLISDVTDFCTHRRPAAPFPPSGPGKMPRPPMGPPQQFQPHSPQFLPPPPPFPPPSPPDTS